LQRDVCLTNWNKTLKPRVKTKTFAPSCAPWWKKILPKRLKAPHPKNSAVMCPNGKGIYWPHLTHRINNFRHVKPMPCILYAESDRFEATPTCLRTASLLLLKVTRLPKHSCQPILIRAEKAMLMLEAADNGACTRYGMS